MPTITVRGLDADVITALKVRAARAGHSMEAEVRSILTASVAASPARAGLGTAIAAIFAGADAPEFPRRSEFPQPLT